jgi:hypothetical protein
LTIIILIPFLEINGMARPEIRFGKSWPRYFDFHEMFV